MGCYAGEFGLLESEPVPVGPGKCPTEGCDNFEDGNSPTGQCIECVERIYAAALVDPSPR